MNVCLQILLRECSLMPAFVGVVFICISESISHFIIMSVFVIGIVKGIRTWSYNNSQPVLAVVAKVVAKRTDVTNHVQILQIMESIIIRQVRPTL